MWQHQRLFRPRVQEMWGQSQTLGTAVRLGRKVTVRHYSQMASIVYIDVDMPTASSQCVALANPRQVDWSFGCSTLLGVKRSSRS